MSNRLKPLLLIGLYLVVLACLSPSVFATCSDTEMTAVFAVRGIYPGDDLNLHLLSVLPVGPATYPGDAEMIAAVRVYWPDPYGHLQRVATAGNFTLIYESPGDFGYEAMVDIRSGEVVFAAGVVWMGYGERDVPPDSTHDWAFLPGEPAPVPESTLYLPSVFWSESYGGQADITESVLADLRRSDVMHSFGECGPYEVTSYIHTPTVGGTNPYVAECILVVSGFCGPPWNGDPTGAGARTWSAVKTLYR